LFLDIEHALTL
jgi:2-polyprenyl-6-methoxyphenol hydroxylase-like FAD-dependent oxidoreductase